MVLKDFSNLTRKDKLRLLQIYMRSKINHLIPMIAVAGDITKSWRLIRSTLFLDINYSNTTLKELFSAFG